MVHIAYVDLRCLQDYKYRIRGIGHHVAALLRTRLHSSFADWKLIGLIDPKGEDLPPELAALVDEVSASLNPCTGNRRSVFIDGTPMSHDMRFSLRFVGNPSVLSAVAVHDFIPLDWPGYLPTVGERIEYLAKVGRLKKFDCYLPVSHYTARRLSELLGVSQERMCVTGSSVRDSLYKLSTRPDIRSSDKNQRQPYFLLIGGPDRRKNLEVVVRALRNLNLLYSETISLKIVGDVWRVKKDALFELAGHPEGGGFLEFLDEITDQELVKLFANALATVVPSHIEGFSLPVVEAAVCGSPVIASDCAAHLELIEQPEALFPSSDATVLANKLEAVLNNEALRGSLIKSQAQLAAKFHENEVGRRFWGAIEAEAEDRFRSTSQPICRKKQPHVAFLSTYPPEQSEAAFYTAMTIQAGNGMFHSDLYTDAPRPLESDGQFQNADVISAVPLLNGKYDAIISVIGNSHSHRRALEFFERYGGPCLLHDIRLPQVYFEFLGQEKFLTFATDILGRPVSVDEAHSWLADDRPASPLFLERVIERASPLIVQTASQQALIKQRYGFYPEVARSCPAAFFEKDELTACSRQAMRERLDLDSAAFVMSSFGCRSRSRSTDACVITVDLLRHWNIPAELYLIDTTPAAVAEIKRMAVRYGVAEYVHCVDTAGGSTGARDFLVASDAGIQLRTYAFGAVSTLLSDCISAGLPSVTTTDMAISCDAPVYISTVPDHFSPLYIAEKLAVIWESRHDRSLYEGARVSYLETHNFEYYAKRLTEILGIA